MNFSKTQAILSISAIKQNITQLKKMAPKAKLLAMVKADAYGHGMLGVSKIIAPLVEGLAVATVEEAFLLRSEHPNIATIAVMEGIGSLDELHCAIQHHFTLVLHHQYELDLLEQYASKITNKITNKIKPIPVWVQIDIGMHRLGFFPTEIPNIVLRLTALQKKGVIVLTTWMTHFSASEDRADKANQKQLKAYYDHVAPLPGEKSLANSAAIVHMPESHQDWIRPGLLLYGASPIMGQSAKTLGFHPVMSLSTVVLAIRTVPSGTRVGYNGVWEAKRDSVIATIGIGYGDGYPRHIVENTPVWIQNKRFPIIGKVSMDMMMVDITDNDSDNDSDNSIVIGTKVELWGKHISVEELAKQANTIPYALFCQLTKRVNFRWEAI